MPLSKIPATSFNAWIKCGTWHTGHDNDEGRFYAFVWNVAKFSRRQPSESEIRDLILKEWRGRLEEDYLQTKARNYSNLYRTLLDFAAARTKGRLFLPQDHL